MKRTQQTGNRQHFSGLIAGRLSVRLVSVFFCTSEVFQVTFHNCFAQSPQVREAVTPLISNSRIHIPNRAPCLRFLKAESSPPEEAQQTSI